LRWSSSAATFLKPSDTYTATNTVTKGQSNATHRVCNGC
jgi:hypothetical protein